MASASQGGQAGGLSGSQSHGLWLCRGHSEGMGWAWFACPAFTQTCPPPGLGPPLCLPPHSWLSMGYWPPQLRAEANAQGTAVMCHRSWPHRSPSLPLEFDGGLRLLGPFHSLFLPLGLSPAFLSPAIGWGLCPNARRLQRACAGPASAWLPTCSLPAGSPLLLQRLGSSPTWHSACIAFPHDVSLTPTCASVPGLILLHPLPWVLATRTSALQAGFPC